MKIYGIYLFCIGLLGIVSMIISYLCGIYGYFINFCIAIMFVGVILGDKP